MLTASDYIINYNYYLLVKQQIEALKRTSAYCFQDVTLACKKAHFHVNGTTNQVYTLNEHSSGLMYYGIGQRLLYYRSFNGTTAAVSW